MLMLQKVFPVTKMSTEAVKVAHQDFFFYYSTTNFKSSTFIPPILNFSILCFSHCFGFNCTLHQIKVVRILSRRFDIFQLHWSDFTPVVGYLLGLLCACSMCVQGLGHWTTILKGYIGWFLK